MGPDVIIIEVPPDNYCYLIASQTDAVVIDPADAESVTAELEKHNLNLRFICATHHHSDHTAGVNQLKKLTGALVYGGDKRISSIDRVFDDGETFTLNDIRIEVLAMPGHTRHQVAYYLPDNGMVFTGDTLFGGGCGRIFEGSPDQLYHSLMRLSELPDNTLVYFGHEYTLDNLQFAALVDSANEEVKSRLEQVRPLRSQNKISVPSTIELEKKTNPFLRVHSLAIRKYLGMVDRSPVAVFEELRKRKNSF